MYDVIFPHLGIAIEHLPNSFTIFGYKIAFYGCIIGLGILIGLLLTWKEAERTGQNPDDYTDCIIYGIIGGVVGARVYYVAFTWDYYKDHLSEIFNLRSGGLAIYGTVIGAFLVVFIWSRIKKKRFIRLLDTMVPQLALAQAMGRWGNFFNMEAFGRYTDSLFAMQLRKAAVSPNMMDEEVLKHVLTINGTEYIQVHPTFLYESCWCLILFFLLRYLQRHQRFRGQILCAYIGLYGFERMLVEGLRTDSLMLGNSGIRVSQLLAGVCFAGALIVYLVLLHKNRDVKPQSVFRDPEQIEISSEETQK